MSAADIDAYLADVPEPHRSTLDAMRRAILEVVPEAEEGLAYGVPGFHLGDKTIAGFSAAKNHVSYLPHSGSVIGSLPGGRFAGLETSKGAVKMPPDTPLPLELIRDLIAARRAEAGV